MPLIQAILQNQTHAKNSYIHVAKKNWRKKQFFACRPQKNIENQLKKISSLSSVKQILPT